LLKQNLYYRSHVLKEYPTEYKNYVLEEICYAYRPAIRSTRVFWFSKEAMDPTFTKFSGNVGKVKG